MEYEVTKIDDSTWALGEGFVRFFLLAGREKALLIDTGMNVSAPSPVAKRAISFSPSPLLLNRESALFLQGNTP